MIIYSVTCKVDAASAKQWEDYFIATHLDDVKNTGCFTGYSFRKELSEDADVVFVSEYYASSMVDLDRYNESFAHAMKQDILDKFSGQFTAIRRIYTQLIVK